MKGKRGIAAASTLGGLTAATPGAGALASSLGERSSKGVAVASAAWMPARPKITRMGLRNIDIGSADNRVMVRFLLRGGDMQRDVPDLIEA